MIVLARESRHPGKIDIPYSPSMRQFPRIKKKEKKEKSAHIETSKLNIPTLILDK